MNIAVEGCQEKERGFLCEKSLTVENIKTKFLEILFCN